MLADMFVIIEAPFTFRGDPKPLHFRDAMCRRFASFAGKIVHIVIEQDMTDPDMEDAAWHREFQSRVSHFSSKPATMRSCNESSLVRCS